MNKCNLDVLIFCVLQFFDLISAEEKYSFVQCAFVLIDNDDGIESDVVCKHTHTLNRIRKTDNFSGKTYV